MVILDKYGLPVPPWRIIQENFKNKHLRRQDSQRAEGTVKRSNKYGVAPCEVCGGKTKDVSGYYFRDKELKGGAHAEECENCGYLGKEIDDT